ncbi:DUF6381 family protein [Streptomyces sp. NBC_01619]|uniref:DUF6381 family protein n=1 Tax=Streptomyces sp. NBC_01619 TaxID=2975901 RepID=UPI0022504C23|nr:DUF6381 family protein [Streptomyces sp. NBC_01619]MCX4514145.1 DUF6381 family protein [Streptomyces sp. NBC_01619]
MSTAGEPVRTSEQVRVMAEELDRGAERCKDPEHRARLRRRAEQLRREYDGDDGDDGAPDAPAPSRQDQQQHHRRHGPPRGPHGPGPDRPRGA